MKSNAIFVLVCVGLFVNDVTCACDCGDADNEAKYCGGDFAIKMTIGAMTETDDHFQYDVKLGTEYRYVFI